MRALAGLLPFRPGQSLVVAEAEIGRLDDFKADLMDAESSQLDTWRCRLASLAYCSP